MSTTRKRLLLTGAKVFRHDGNLDSPDLADILIADGVIQSIGACGTVAVGNGNAGDDADHDIETIDLKGHLLIPGFVNAHYHSHDVLAKGCFESLPLEQWGLIAGPIANHRSLAEIRLRTLVGAIEALRNGITTVQDFSSFAPMQEPIVDTILDAYKEAGLRVIYSITLRDRSQLDTILDANQVVPADLRALVGEHADQPEPQLEFVEEQLGRVGDRDGMVIWALSPSAPQRCSPRLLSGVADLANKHGLPVYTHVYEARGQRIFAQRHYADHAGSMLRYMEANGLVGPHVNIAHGVWPDPVEIEHLARTGTGVVLNMLSNLRLRNGVAPIAAYRRMGVRLALGSDNCSCSDIHSMFPVMKMYCLLGGIMEPEESAPIAAEAMRLGTLGGARSAGRADQLGALEPGMRADLVALDLADPAYRPLHSVVRQLVFAETGRAVRHVWVDGRQVVRDGKSSTVDELHLMDELADVMPAVRDKLEKLKEDAARLSPVFTELQRRAWAEPLAYNRYLQK
jgi:5-methylthioadenosine/S-adenosylhomocysteine deaminase